MPSSSSSVPEKWIKVQNRIYSFTERLKRTIDSSIRPEIKKARRRKEKKIHHGPSSSISLLCDECDPLKFKGVNKIALKSVWLFCEKVKDFWARLDLRSADSTKKEQASTIKARKYLIYRACKCTFEILFKCNTFSEREILQTLLLFSRRLMKFFDLKSKSYSIQTIKRVMLVASKKKRFNQQKPTHFTRRSTCLYARSFHASSLSCSSSELKLDSDEFLSLLKCMDFFYSSV